SVRTTSTVGPTSPISATPQEPPNLDSVVNPTEQSVLGLFSTSPSSSGVPPPIVSTKDLLSPFSPFVPDTQGSLPSSLPPAPTHIPSTSYSSAPSSVDLSRIILLLHSMQASQQAF
ncbi:hypothetical protein U1Q18_037543, partial [Sarracenia purpurea var. burkii]